MTERTAGPPVSDGQFSLCAKCGACTSVCPVHRVTGRESLTARGRLHLLSKMGEAEAGRELAAIFSKCLLCGACRTVCPRGIDIPALVMAARAELPTVSGFSSFAKFLAQQALARPALLPPLAKAAGLLGLFPALPVDSGLRLSLTEAPEPLPSPGELVATGRPLDSAPLADQPVLYFGGCLANHVYPEIGLTAEQLLARLCALRLLTPEGQSCCGLAAKTAGEAEQARELARRTIGLFSPPEAPAAPIITTCASCYAALKDYPALFVADPDWRAKAEAFSQRVWEFADFLLRHGVSLDHAFRRDLPPRALVYHDPCHLRNLGLTAAPRQLLDLAPGLKRLELPHGPQCCGRGGLFHLAHPDLSQAIRRPLIDDFLATGAELVVTTCSGCLLQWQQGLKAADSAAQATHLALLLWSQLV